MSQKTLFFIIFLLFHTLEGRWDKDWSARTYTEASVYSPIHTQGEWLLLFNSILPFQEVLSQVIQVPISSSGIRITASTEAVS